MWFFRKKTKKEQSIQQRHKRINKANVEEVNYGQYRKPVLGGILFLISILFISFWGQFFVDHQLFLNHTAKFTIVSNIDFEYTSEVKTKLMRDQMRQRIAPVYRVDLKDFRKFVQKVENLKTQLDHISSLTDKEVQKLEIDNLVKSLSEKGVTLQAEDFQTLLQIADPIQRNRLIDEGMFILQETVQRGILDDVDSNGYISSNLVVSSQDDESANHMQTKGNALRSLRMGLFVMDVEYEIANVLMHILKVGLTPNVVYDRQKTELKIEQVLNQLPKVVVRVHRGETIAESGQLVNQEIYECFLAYQKQLMQTDHYRSNLHVLMARKLLLGCLLFLCFLLSLYLIPTKIKKASKFLWMTALILLLNVALLRAASLCCFYGCSGNPLLFYAVAPYLAPTFLTSLLLSTLVDIPGSIICTFFIVGLKSFIFRVSLEYFFIDLCISLLAIYLSYKVSLKKELMRICFVVYSVLALVTFAYSLGIQRLELVFCYQQILAIYLACFVTMICLLCLLPICERYFGCDANITFLELTDFNHPLLRKLQLLAPGTYHHSLLVAALAEKVADELGANSLLCRCCALYHDIGKMVKPEYFTENQKNGENPHEHQTPTMSAVILKSHIKEGVSLAKSYKLPQSIIDAIQQHHGTSLIKYFYAKALRQQKDTDEPVDPFVFRYDGPKPQFKEAAILLLADSVEAASRSLQKVSAQAITELIEKIVQDKILDGQLDECCITLQEIDRLKKSFQVSLLNMLHSRISYSDAQKEIEKAQEASHSKPTEEPA